MRDSGFGVFFGRDSGFVEKSIGISGIKCSGGIVKTSIFSSGFGIWTVFYGNTGLNSFIHSLLHVTNVRILFYENRNKFTRGKTTRGFYKQTSKYKTRTNEIIIYQ